MEVRMLDNDGRLGPSTAAYENGQLWLNYQMSLFVGSKQSEMEKKFLKEIGREWWEVLSRLNQSVHEYRYRLAVLSSEERSALQAQENLKNAIMGRLEQEMKEEEFLAAKWRFIDSPIYKNRKPPLTDDLKFVTDSTVRRYYNDALVKTGTVAFRKKWPIPDKNAWGAAWGFFGGLNDDDDFERTFETSQPEQGSVDLQNKKRVVRFVAKSPTATKNIR